jgi:4-amino-4-deoxy-L-arabinose transferase-like glycosyltransferase
MSALAQRALPIAFSLAIFLAVALPAASRLTLNSPTGGSRHRVSMAYHLWKHGVVSSQSADRPDVAPDCRREPFYSFVLAGLLALTADPEVTTRQCLAVPEPECVPLFRRLKLVNVVVMALLAPATFWAGRLLLGGGPLPYLAAGIIATQGSLWRSFDVMKSELLASLLLVVACACLYLAAARARKRTAAVAAGLSLGALMLTKAVFFYAGPVLLAGAALAARRQRRTAVAVLGAVALAYAVAAPWVARNVALGLGFGVSLDREVLAIRAEHDAMTWREWAASWFYFAAEGTPLAGRALDALFEPADWARLREDDEDGFYLMAKKNRGVVAARTGVERPTERQTFDAAKAIVLENWPMHLALTGPFTIRGVWVGQTLVRWPPARLALRIVSNLLVPALLLAGVLLAARRAWPALWFFALPLYSYAFHAGMTQNIPRFSWPILPEAALALCLLLALAAQRLLPDRKGAAAPGLRLRPPPVS